MTAPDSLRPYFRELGPLTVLSAEAQHNLAVQYRRTRNPALAQRLVASNLRLVVKIAREFRARRDDFADLIQEGNLGLMRAVEKFDPRRGVKLTSYAGWWIRAYIMRFLMEQGQAVKLGTSRASRRDFLAGRRPPADLSLNQPVKSSGAGDDSTRCCRLDLLSDEEEKRPDQLVETCELRARFDEMLGDFTASVSSRDREVIQRRWLEDEPATLADVGRSFALSGERVRQLERNLWDVFRKTAFDGLAA